MKALVFDGQALRLESDQPAPTRADTMVVVRTVLAGICNTDLEIVRGYMGFTGVLGHELLGVVDEGPLELRGKRVVAEINYACGRCPSCEAGLGRHCATRTVMGILNQDGAFAESVAVPIANLHVVPEGVCDEAAVFAEPLAAAFEIREQLTIASGIETLVLGDGKLGLLVAMVLRDAGADVRLVGKHEAHLAIAHDRGIATHLLDSWDRTPRDLVVDATGSAEGFGMAVAATRPRGTLVLKSTVADDTPTSLAPLVINEITVVGSRCGPFAPALNALADGAIDPRDLIAGEHDLSDGVTALEHAATRGTLKVLLRV
jgi:threonine dehydrogenase-like Zn-dependent dehydrogenase